MNRRTITALISCFLMAAAGCAAGETAALSRTKGATMKESEGLYFTDPKTAVTVISGLIEQSDWPALSRYYDLSGSAIGRGELESGRFFVRTERPPLAHPGGFWRIRHPFDPSFRYRYHQTLSGGQVRVHLSIEIDQGGGMIQRGMHSFLLWKSEKGFQILPFETDEKDPAPSLVK
jgi:hypothetical protein